MENQKNFLDDPSMLARRTDPRTSKLAANEVAETGELKGLRLRAYLAVQSNPGCIARELSAVLGDNDPRTLNRRLGEVETMGLISRGETRRCKVTGKMCATWWPKDSK